MALPIAQMKVAISTQGTLADVKNIIMGAVANANTTPVSKDLRKLTVGCKRLLAIKNKS